MEQVNSVKKTVPTVKFRNNVKNGGEKTLIWEDLIEAEISKKTKLPQIYFFN